MANVDAPSSFFRLRSSADRCHLVAGGKRWQSFPSFLLICFQRLSFGYKDCLVFFEEFSCALDGLCVHGCCMFVWYSRFAATIAKMTVKVRRLRVVGVERIPQGV